MHSTYGLLGMSRIWPQMASAPVTKAKPHHSGSVPNPEPHPHPNAHRPAAMAQFGLAWN